MKPIVSRFKPFSRMANTSKPDETLQGKSSCSETTTCMICTAAKTATDMFTSSVCSHSFCTDCLSKHIAVKLEDSIETIKCPEPNCETVLEPNACNSFVPKEVMDRWGDALSEAMILGMQLLFCPFVDCSAMLVDDGGDEAVREVDCPSCRRKFCAQCKVGWHGEMGCEEFQKLRGFDDHKVCGAQKSFTETLEGESSSSEPTCMICMDTKTAAEMFQNSGCSHSFCTDCISQHIAAKVENNIANVKCPEPNCETVLDPSTCDSFVPKVVLDRWGDALCEAVILGRQRFYCPFIDCSVMLIDDGDETVREAECPSCRRMFCAQCRVGWHGEMLCEEFQREGGSEDLIAKKFAKEKNWKRCPNCRIYVERIDGCPHIKCRCGSQFCYSCGAKWGGDHACPESAEARRYHR